MTDSFELQRFVDAQASGTYEQALGELRAGRKRSHWIWFIFPQIAGLGRSPMAQRYAISGLPEATAYLAHPVLGPRLIDCAQAMLDLPGGDAVAVLGSIDAIKLRSSMTLFARADMQSPDQPPAASVFSQVLDKYFGGRPDVATISLL